MTTAIVYNLPPEAKAAERLRLLASYLLELSKQQPEERPAVWFVPARWEALDIDPRTESDALVGDVFKFLQERFGANGHQGRASTFEKIALKSMGIYRPREAAFGTMLGLVYYEDSLYAFVCGSDGVPSDPLVRPWVEALAHAERTAASGHPQHAWHAVVGPTASLWGRTPLLAEDEAVVGGLVLERCNFDYEERVPAHSPSLSGWSNCRWAPVIVRGSSQGHDWRAAEFAALRQIHRLCALLSIDTAWQWTLKESPRPPDWGSLHFPGETSLGALKQEGKTGESEASGTTAPRLDSARLSRMWARCSEDERLLVPAEAYLQAVSLRESHPSFALVGFVGAIEEAGKLLIEVARPEQCPTCGKDRTNSSAERFREALRLVLPEDKLQAVSRDLYRWRSGTAHAGRTHGWESAFGRHEMGASLLVNPPESMFSLRGTRRADELARDLLLVLLDGPTLTGRAQAESSATA